MHEKHGRVIREAVIPTQQVVLITMRGEAAECVYLCLATDALAMDADFGLAVHELASQRAGRLEPDDDHVALRSIQIVLEVMEHPAAVGHA